jgi:hypothetical protein
VLSDSMCRAARVGLGARHPGGQSLRGAAGERRGSGGGAAAAGASVRVPHVPGPIGTLRHSFATSLERQDMRTPQETSATRGRPNEG